MPQRRRNIHIHENRARQRIHGLEALRGFAAAYVFLHHAAPVTSPSFAKLLSFGQEAVILFFVLSGFVIYHSVWARRESPDKKMYLVHRMRRIYPVFGFALLWSYALQCITRAQWVNPELQLLGMNLGMMQDVGALKRGVWAETYMGDSPLWSLSYEWWFYLLFIPLGLRTKTPSMLWPLTISVIGFLTYQAQPNHASLIAGYFMIWWTGVELAKEFAEIGSITWTRQRASCAALGGLTLLWLFPVIVAYARHAPLRLGVDPVLQFRHYTAALCFLGICLAWHRAGFSLWRPLVVGLARLAPISFSLYVLHYPALTAAATLYPQTPPALRAVGVFMAIVPVCYLVEVRVQKVINRWTDQWTSRINPTLPFLGGADRPS
jgi:peptidoglycan/LPS O-acetylase OafA/YrhL